MKYFVTSVRFSLCENSKCLFFVQNEQKKGKYCLIIKMNDQKKNPRERMLKYGRIKWYLQATIKASSEKRPIMAD